MIGYNLLLFNFYSTFFSFIVDYDGIDIFHLMLVD